MYTELLPEVEKFLKDKEKQYITFLDDVRGVAQTMKAHFGGDFVREIYSRKAKQGSELKSAAKIAKALAAERKNDDSASAYSITDIVGLTILVYYPDQICAGAKWMWENHGLKAEVKKNEYMHGDGYHAHHMVFFSTDARYPKLSCEVQIKTMLHDAWAAKGHDLNYKPHGKTDARLSRMMQLFGDSLQSIEVQSEVLRNMIHARWNAETNRRQLVRKAVWIELGRDQTLDPEAMGLLEEIKNAAKKTEMTSGNLQAWNDIFDRIIKLGEPSRRDGVWLAVNMAMVSSKPEHISFASSEVGDFLKSSNKLKPTGMIVERDVWSLPLALSACGDFVSAIDISQRSLDERKDLGARSIITLKFNMANYLAEEACFSAPKDDEERSALRTRIELLIAECTSTKEEIIPNGFQDLRAMVEVALSDDPAKLRLAIDEIHQAMQSVPAKYADYASPYLELHLRVAWRRLLEVEAEKSAAA
jgi:ppGpp synthetase/RelA/SpoT-type nucleotidyltranferase